MLDPFVDRCFEFRDIVEDASADALARDLGEEPLDEIEPRTGCRREMQLETLVPGEPALHLLCLVRGVIVDDQMQIEMGGRLAADLPQERQEFVRPVAWQTFADDLASRHIKRGDPDRPRNPAMTRWDIVLRISKIRSSIALMFRQDSAAG